MRRIPSFMVAVALGCDAGPSVTDAGSDATPCEADPPAPASCAAPPAGAAVVQVIDDGVAVVGGEALAHDVDGVTLVRATTDAAGCATLPAAAGALVTVVFPYGTNAGTIVTARVPDNGRLTIHGTSYLQPSAAPICDPVKVRLSIATQPPVAHERIDFLRTVPWPWCRLAIDEDGAYLLSPRCLRADGGVDGLVIAQRTTLTPPASSYPVAASLVSAPVVDGQATLNATTWSPIGDPCPPLIGAPLDHRCVYWFGGYASDYDLPAFTPDRVTLMTVGARAVRLNFTTRPASIVFDASNDLPPLAATPVVVDATRLALQWPASLPAADLVAVEVTWLAQSFVGRWIVVLPADATAATFPDVQLPSLGLPQPTPGPIDRLDVTRMYIDADHGGDYAQAVAGGLYTVRSSSPRDSLWIVAPETPRTRLTQASGL